MAGKKPLHITTSKAREELAELVNRVAYAGERVVFTRHGKDMAALISIADFKKLTEKQQD